jgi:hypothetical protein
MSQGFDDAEGQITPGTPYRLVRVAAGGAGVVYEVEDATIEKLYVLKTLQLQSRSSAD